MIVDPDRAEERRIAKALLVLRELADQPFELGAFESFFRERGLRLRKDEYGEVFRVSLLEPNELIIAFASEAMASLPIKVFSEECDASHLTVSNEQEFQDAFEKLAALAETHLDAPNAQGQYESRIIKSPAFDAKNRLHRYALWLGSVSWLAVLQHHEGDGHLGNLASLDIRVFPRGAEQQPDFPLKTNVIH